MDNQTLLDRYSQVGPINQGAPILLPDTGAVRKRKRKTDPLVGIVANLNRDRDLNITHDFDYWIARDSDLLDDSAFSGIQRKIMANRFKFNNFSGDPRVDFTNIGMAERQYYSDFLGINFKKIGHALGSAATSVAHAGRSVVTGAAHDIRDVAVDVAHAGRDVVDNTAHGIRAASLAVAHTERNFAVDTAHGVRTVGKGVLYYEKGMLKFTEKNWKPILAGMAIVALAATGVGLPLAIAAGGGLLTALEKIPAAVPELPPGFGDGGGDDQDGGAGFPQGMGDQDPDDDGLTDDTGQGLTYQDQARMQQQAAAAQAQQALIDAAAAKKRKMMIVGLSILAIGIAYWYFKKK